MPLAASDNNCATRFPARPIAGRKGVSATPSVSRPALASVDYNSGFVVASDTYYRTIYAASSGHGTSASVDVPHRSNVPESADALTALIRRVDPALHGLIRRNTAAAHLALQSTVTRMRSSLPPFVPGSTTAPLSVSPGRSPAPPCVFASSSASAATFVPRHEAAFRVEMSDDLEEDWTNLVDDDDVTMHDAQPSDDDLLRLRMQQLELAHTEVDAMPEWFPELSSLERVLWRTAWNDTAGSFTGSFSEWTEYNRSFVLSNLAALQAEPQLSLEELAATYLRPIVAKPVSTDRHSGGCQFAAPNIYSGLVMPIASARRQDGEALVRYKSWVADGDEALEAALDLQLHLPGGRKVISALQPKDTECDAHTSDPFSLIIDYSPFVADSDVAFDDI